MYVPSVDGRSKREDLKRVARLRIYEWQQKCTQDRVGRAHIVSKALGLDYCMNILEEIKTPEVIRWEKYCEALYEAIPEYLLELIK